MKYVLDVSVAVRWVIPNQLTPKALRLRGDYENKIHELVAPDIFIAEAANALTKAERQKLIAVGQSTPLHTKITTSLPDLHSHFPLVARALAISSQTRSSFYDCLYVALAERERCELVTADEKLVRNLKAQFPFVRPLASIP
jgi:predicted nucleic acid-binding protein